MMPATRKGYVKVVEEMQMEATYSNWKWQTVKWFLGYFHTVAPTSP